MAPVSIPIFAIAAPDDSFVLIGGVPDLLTVVSATITADDSRTEYAFPTVRAPNLTPAGKLGLYLFEFFRWDDRFVIRFYIILWYFTFVQLVLLCQEVYCEGFLQ